MSMSKFGNQVIKTAIYAKQRKQSEDRKIYNTQKRIEKRKHDNAKEKLKKHERGEINLTEKRIEKYNKDLEYKAKSPEEVRLETKKRQQEKHKEYVSSIGKGKYICSKLFGDWVLFLGNNKKGEGQ